MAHKKLRSFRKYTCKSCKGSCKGRKIKAKFGRFFKERFDYVTLLECGNIALQNRGILNASWGKNGDYMLVWHDVFNPMYLSFAPAFKVLRPSFKL